MIKLPNISTYYDGEGCNGIYSADTGRWNKSSSTATACHIVDFYRVFDMCIDVEVKVSRG